MGVLLRGNYEDSGIYGTVVLVQSDRSDLQEFRLLENEFFLKFPSTLSALVHAWTTVEKGRGRSSRGCHVVRPIQCHVSLYGPELC